MYDFLLQTIFFVSLGVIIYMLARAVPRVTESGETVHTTDIFDRILSRLPLSKIDARLNLLIEKFLRRVKVWILKIDNLVNKRLKNIKSSEKNGGGKKTKIDFFDKISDDKK